MGLVCISLKTQEVEYFFSFTYWPFVYPLWRIVHSNLLFILRLDCLLLSFESSLDILDTSHWPDMWLRGIFSQCMTGLLTLLAVSFSVQNLYLNKVQFINFFLLMDHAPGTKPKKFCPA